MDCSTAHLFYQRSLLRTTTRYQSWTNCQKDLDEYPQHASNLTSMQ